MIKEALKGIGLALVFALVVFTGLHEIKGSASTETLSKNSIAIKYMKDNFDEYDKCRYSVENGETRIGWITLSYHYKISDELKQKLEDVTDQFMETVKSKCATTIDKYEQTRSTQEKTSKEIAEAQLSLYDKWILKKSVDENSQKLTEPSKIRLPQDENLYTFSNEEVKNYFFSALGY